MFTGNSVEVEIEGDLLAGEGAHVEGDQAAGVGEPGVQVQEKVLVPV